MKKDIDLLKAGHVILKQEGINRITFEMSSDSSKTVVLLNQSSSHLNIDMLEAYQSSTPEGLSLRVL